MLVERKESVLFDSENKFAVAQTLISDRKIVVCVSDDKMIVIYLCSIPQGINGSPGEPGTIGTDGEQVSKLCTTNFINHKTFYYIKMLYHKINKQEWGDREIESELFLLGAL